MSLLCISAVQAQAQQLSLRSGDHPTFSRITLPVPASQNWEARQTKNGIQLTLSEHSDGFDISEVFLRMPRDRISHITTTKGSLTLHVKCACRGTAFRSGELLVIDVADEGTKLAGPPLMGAPLFNVQRPNAAVRSAKVRPVSLPWIGSGSSFEASAIADGTTRTVHDETILAPNIEERAALLNEIQKNLGESVASAASTGLLENSYAAPIKQLRPMGEADVIPDTPSTELPETAQSTSQNLRITSSMDLPSWIPNHLGVAPLSDMACPDADVLALDTWGTEDEFSAQIGPARTAIMNARDQFNINAARTLAQLYLYFGFGAEALDALRLDPSVLEANGYLANVASILEFGAVNGHNMIGSYTDCKSDIALWAMLSFRQLPQGIMIDTNAVLRALNKLPKNLRSIIAPQLSERFLQYGDQEAAAASMRSIERLPEALSPEGAMAQAGIAIDAGQPAEALLEDVIETNSLESPAALIKLVEGKLSNDEQLSYETATLIEAYAQELRGTELGNQLRRTQILALSQSERFEEAFTALDALSPSLSPEATTQLRQIALERLTQKAADFTFLEHLFAQREEALAKLPSQTKLQLAKRLMDLGFAAQVQLMLEMVTETRNDKTRQLLAARAALALRQPFQAQAALFGIDGQEVQLLLAEAKEMSGAYREASEIFANSNATTQAAQAAWLSEDWRELTSAQTPGFGPVAALAEVEPVIKDTNLGPLGRANKALQESGNARSTLEQFLNDPLVQISPDS